MTGLRLYKKEKLCSVSAIDALFSPSAKGDGGNNGIMAYPWRAVWREGKNGADVSRFLISVPKKRLRHAVDRVTMRRRMREAYRLNRRFLGTAIAEIAFIYVADKLTDYARTEKSVIKILTHIAGSVETEND